MHHRLPILTLLAGVVSMAVFILPGATTRLEFDRAALASGEWWRVVTAHFTHFDANHLAWNVAALLALGLACETISRSGFALSLGLASPIISAAVWLFQPQFASYRGLSGLDSALFGFFATTLIQQRRRAPVMLGVIAILGFSAKCGFEIATGATAFASGGGYAPVPLAHGVGLCCGITAALAARAHSGRNTPLGARVARR